MGEDVGDGELALLALGGLGLVGGEGSNVDEPGDAVVSSCGGDDASAVRVADEDGGAADPPEGAQERGDVAFGRVEAVL